MLLAKDSSSELQFRDVKNLISSDFDKAYLNKWMTKLDLKKVWEDIIK